MSPDVLKAFEQYNVPFFRSPKEIDELPSPRVIRTHLTFELLNPNLLESTKVSKYVYFVYVESRKMHIFCSFGLFQVVYVARNPKDVIVSFFYFHKAMKHMFFKGNFEQFVDLFLNDKSKFCEPGRF